MKSITIAPVFLLQIRRSRNSSRGLREWRKLQHIAEAEIPRTAVDIIDIGTVRLFRFSCVRTADHHVETSVFIRRADEFPHIPGQIEHSVNGHIRGKLAGRSSDRKVPLSRIVVKQRFPRFVDVAPYVGSAVDAARGLFPFESARQPAGEVELFPKPGAIRFRRFAGNSDHRKIGGERRSKFPVFVPDRTTLFRGRIECEPPEIPPFSAGDFNSFQNLRYSANVTSVAPIRKDGR